MKVIIAVAVLMICVLFPPQISAATYTSEPTKIIIPSLNVSLPVHTAKIIFDTWEVHLDGASFGEGTTLPGNKGNTAIFSHARQGLFGDLPQIKKGAIVHVFTKYDWFMYQVEDVFVVKPEQIDVLNDHNKYELTLYTCIGDNWSERHIVKAKLLANPSTLRQN